MSINIIEIKAHCKDPERIRDILNKEAARFKGLDHQIDTYFNVQNGRLKLRQGNVESALIQYNRPNQAGPKHSQVALYKPNKAEDLKKTLENSIGIKVVVDKQRYIYFVDNVKIHVDEVQGLGSFLEIEAIDENNEKTLEELNKQCEYFMGLFGVQTGDLLDVSYSDLLLQKGE